MQTYNFRQDKDRKSQTVINQIQRKSESFPEIENPLGKPARLSRGISKPLTTETSQQFSYRTTQREVFNHTLDRQGKPDELFGGRKEKAISGISDGRAYHNSTELSQVQSHVHAPKKPGQENHLPKKTCNVVQQKLKCLQLKGSIKGGFMDVKYKKDNIETKATTDNNGLVQLMTIIGDNKISKNRKYLISKDDSQLFVKTNANSPIPASMFAQKGSKDMDGESWNVWEYTNETQHYINDCQKHAKALASNDPGSYSLFGQIVSGKTQDLHPLKEDATISNSTFTENVSKYQKNPDNLESIKDYRNEQQLEIHIGEAYGIVPKKPVNGINFHAATVVAKDQSDQITSEANAALPNGSPPVFDMYGAKTDTFYDEYKSLYSTTPDTQEADMDNPNPILPALWVLKLGAEKKINFENLFKTDKTRQNEEDIDLNILEDLAIPIPTKGKKDN